MLTDGTWSSIMMSMMSGGVTGSRGPGRERCSGWGQAIESPLVSNLLAPVLCQVGIAAGITRLQPPRRAIHGKLSPTFRPSSSSEDSPARKENLVSADNDPRRD